MTVLPAGSVCTRWYECLDSTNSEAIRRAGAGERGPLWIAARRQTAGRGRRGRTWESEPGNLFATLLMPRPVDRSPAELGFVAGLAAADTLKSWCAASVALKWPNDVLLGGRKVAGILLEGGAAALAAGIGINLARHPVDTEFPATSVLAAAGRAPAPEEALARLAACWSTWYEVWETKGFAPVREAWLSRAAGLGGAITVRLADSGMEGVFETIDGDGALLLRDREGARLRIAAGDVYFGV